MKFLNVKSKTFKIIVDTSIYFFIILFLYFFVGKPISRMIEKEKRASQAVEKRLAEVQKLILENPNPKQKIQEIIDKRKEFEKRSNAENELPRIIQQLTQTSSELNIEIISIKKIEALPFKEILLPQGVSKAYLEIVVKAPYKTIGEYLEALTVLPIICTIEGISLKKFVDLKGAVRGEKSTDSEGKIIATLIVSSYTVWRM